MFAANVPITTETGYFKTDWEDWNVIQGRHNSRHVDMKETISTGLTKRLVSYASKRLKDAGLDSMTVNAIHVYTINGDQKIRTYREYGVRFINPTGSYIEVVRIHIGAGGWPFRDYRFHIEEA